MFGNKFPSGGVINPLLVGDFFAVSAFMNSTRVRVELTVTGLLSPTQPLSYEHIKQGADF